jgi:hypothetical protein
MSIFSKRFTSVATAVAVIASLAVASPAAGAVQKFGKRYTVSATVKGGKNLTVLLISGSGRLLASKKITKTKQNISLSSPATSAIGGSTLQLVSSGGKAKGRYYGPVLLGAKGKSAAKASRVYTKLKQAASSKVKLGTLTIVKVSKSGKQGYARASVNSKDADTTAGAQVKASRGRPLGVGTYGKTATTPVTKSGVWTTAIGEPCAPTGTSTCPNGIEVAPPGPQGPANPQQPGNQPGAEIKVNQDDSLGGDKDDDGIPNAFDVNDDGDAVLDSADTTTPAPKAAADNGTTTCGAVDFKIFTNYKATQGGFAGTLNAYGEGAFKADTTNIASTITKTMSMVFSPIASVCGSAVTRTFLKGVGVSYAPSEYQELTKTCGTGDYQWLIGAGKMCGTDASGYSFGSGYNFTATDLPSGQDTFSMKVETADSKKYEFTSSPGFVFVTHPMFVAFGTDETSSTKINYAASTPSPDGARITDPTINVKSSDTLYLKVYRPQRLAIDGEKGTFYDLAGFKFTPDIPNGNPSVGKCDLLTTKDEEMASDTPINIEKPPTMILKWDIGAKCYDIAPKNIPWSAGPADFDIQVEPSGPGGNSAQKIRITYIS